ncbi:mechanosensitive ion channel family protein [Spirulina sp. CS-785/01]|uniref:mechanosensitive ion channel family protein n=1 Tax=Spirulina sp. CS-785/01 TaxID=3021716 RepID=UPI00232C1A84|nr:mechanosensitive ion channel family protein [Spirulina sp. CS-785/01]MDB9313915.1 mechanosensitive ion channel family protein [Spirulina sp. CS-785/01]
MLNDWLQLEEEILQYVIELVIRLGIFTVGAVLSPFIGRSLPKVLRKTLKLIGYYLDIDGIEIYNRFVAPFKNALNLTGTFLFLALCLNVLIEYEDLYTFLGVFIYFALSVGIVWLASKMARQVIRRSVISLVQRWFGEVNEVVLIFETLIYVLILLIAVIIFAVGLRLNLVAIGASLGLVGLAISGAAKQTLENLFGTLQLYLDRPYVAGEYIRINFNPYAEDIYGRIESVGLRSTKIRIVAQNTMMIVPNSVMAGKNLENVSRGKKIMAMLCLDFGKYLKQGEQALVKQIVEEACKVFWSFEQANTRLQFCPSEDSEKAGTRLRIIFFITSTSGNSLTLRKRLLELANDAIALKLAAYNLHFTVPEPTVYIDSPMSI